MPLFEPGTRFWHLDEMLKYKLYPRNDNWESKCDFFFSLLSVDCKSKIVLASCFPSKEVFWQKEMLFCHIRENTIQYWSLWEGWRESRDCGDHVIWSFWSVITQVMTLHRGVCVCLHGSGMCEHIWRFNNKARLQVFVLMGRALSLNSDYFKMLMLQTEICLFYFLESAWRTHCTRAQPYPVACCSQADKYVWSQKIGGTSTQSLRVHNLMMTFTSHRP